MHCVETEQTFGKRRHRRDTRSRLFGAGILVDAKQRLHCLIRDISPHGAQIRMHASRLVPDSCYLIDLKNGFAHHASPIWRKGSLSGLRLDDAHALDALPPELEYLNR